MEIEFKRQQNLEWKMGDVIIVQWDQSPNESGKHLFFVTDNEQLFDPKTGLLHDFEYGDYTVIYSGHQTMEVLEVFKNENLTLMLG